MQQIALVNVNQIACHKILIVHAVTPVLNQCGNSYINAYTQQWLKAAKSIGAYQGPTTGRVNDVVREWEHWLSKNGGLPELGEESKCI